MPTQRPFLSNFLAAFRSHTQQPISKAGPSISSSATAVTSAAQSIWTSASTSTSQVAKQQSQPPSAELATTATITSPRPINPKSNPHNSAAAAPSTAAQDRQLHASLSPLQHNVSPQTHLPRSPSSPGLPVYGPNNKPPPSYPTVQESRRARRGSASSSDSGGFREVRGAGGSSPGEKWFIGGITANGEERYYKLGMVRRDRSADRISADRLSL